MLPADDGCAFAQPRHDPVKQKHHEPLGIVVGEEQELPSTLLWLQSGGGMGQLHGEAAAILFAPGSKSVKKRGQPTKVAPDKGRAQAALYGVRPLRCATAGAAGTLADATF